MNGAHGFAAPWYRQFKPISMDWPSRSSTDRQYPLLHTVRPSAYPMNLRTETTENTLGDLGKRAAKGKKKRGIGWPKIAPETLWSMDPQRRPVDVWGVISGNLMGGEDEVLAVAKGYRTSFKNRACDDRATIRGGIAVLHAIGRMRANPDSFRSQIIQGPREDDKLIRAADPKLGGQKGHHGQRLKAAADVMRKRVAALGPRLARAAWGARGLYILQNLKGFNIARGVASGVSSVFGPIGLAISAALTAHGAVISANTKNAAERFQSWLKAGVKGGAAAAKGDRPLPGGASMPVTYKQGRGIAPPPPGPDEEPLVRRRKHHRKGKGGRNREAEPEAGDDVPDPSTTSEPGKQAMPVGLIVVAGLGVILLGAAFLGGGRREQVVVERTSREAPREAARGARRDEREDERARGAA